MLLIITNYATTTNAQSFSSFFKLNIFQILQNTATNEYKIESFKVLPPSVK